MLLLQRYNKAIAFVAKLQKNIALAKKTVLYNAHNVAVWALRMTYLQQAE